MGLLDDITRVRAHLEQNGRVSYRVLKREFDLDEDGLEDIIEELVDVQGIAERGEKLLSLRNDIDSGTAPPEPERREPRAYTPKHLAEKILTSRSALEGERCSPSAIMRQVAGFS